jgi:hypothetical protein
MSNDPLIDPNWNQKSDSYKLDYKKHDLDYKLELDVRDDILHVLIKRLDDMKDVKSQIVLTNYIEDNYSNESYQLVFKSHSELYERIKFCVERLKKLPDIVGSKSNKCASEPPPKKHESLLKIISRQNQVKQEKMEYDSMSSERRSSSVSAKSSISNGTTTENKENMSESIDEAMSLEKPQPAVVAQTNAAPTNPKRNDFYVTNNITRYFGYNREVRGQLMDQKLIHDSDWIKSQYEKFGICGCTVDITDFKTLNLFKAIEPEKKELLLSKAMIKNLNESIPPKRKQPQPKLPETTTTTTTTNITETNQEPRQSTTSTTTTTTTTITETLISPNNEIQNSAASKRTRKLSSTSSSSSSSNSSRSSSSIVITKLSRKKSLPKSANSPTTPTPVTLSNFVKETLNDPLQKAHTSQSNRVNATPQKIPIKISTSSQNTANISLTAATKFDESPAKEETLNHADTTLNEIVDPFSQPKVTTSLKKAAQTNIFEQMLQNSARNKSLMASKSLQNSPPPPPPPKPSLPRIDADKKRPSRKRKASAFTESLGEGGGFSPVAVLDMLNRFRKTPVKDGKSSLLTTTPPSNPPLHDSQREPAASMSLKKPKVDFLSSQQSPIIKSSQIVTSTQIHSKILSPTKKLIKKTTTTSLDISESNPQDNLKSKKKKIVKRMTRKTTTIETSTEHLVEGEDQNMVNDDSSEALELNTSPDDSKNESSLPEVSFTEESETKVIEVCNESLPEENFELFESKEQENKSENENEDEDENESKKSDESIAEFLKKKNKFFSKEKIKSRKIVISSDESGSEEEQSPPSKSDQNDEKKKKKKTTSEEEEEEEEEEEDSDCELVSWNENSPLKANKLESKSPASRLRSSSGKK